MSTVARMKASLVTIALGAALLAGCSTTDENDGKPKGPIRYRFAVVAAPGVTAAKMTVRPRGGGGGGGGGGKTRTDPFGELVSTLTTESALDFTVYMGDLVRGESPDEAEEALVEFKTLSAMVPGKPLALPSAKPQANIRREDLIARLAEHSMPGGRPHWVTSPADRVTAIGVDMAELDAKAELDWLAAELKRVPPEHQVVVFSMRELPYDWPSQDPAVAPPPPPPGIEAAKLLASHPGTRLVVYSEPLDRSKLPVPEDPRVTVFTTSYIPSGIVGVRVPPLSSGQYFVVGVEGDLARVEVRDVAAKEGSKPLEPLLVSLRKTPQP